MKKILFNDKYDLTGAVLNGKKTMTRRIVPSRYVPMIEDGLQGAALIEAQQHGDAFREGEVVAVAQAYKDIAWHTNLNAPLLSVDRKQLFDTAGKNNKMFVKAEWMPHRIRITDIKIERLQAISDEDCLRGGIDWIIGTPGILKKWTFFGTKKTWNTRREAFAALIDRISGKGTWERNPWVFAYTFELIK